MKKHPSTALEAIAFFGRVLQENPILVDSSFVAEDLANLHKGYLEK